VAAYIILSLVAIGRDLENPFGDDVNDLPLDSYCKQLASELDIISAFPRPKMSNFLDNSDNMVLYPLSLEGYDKWSTRSLEDIHGALRSKVILRRSTISKTDSSTEVGHEIVQTKTA
jgi:putative membrane protein